MNLVVPDIGGIGNYNIEVTHWPLAIERIHAVGDPTANPRVQPEPSRIALGNGERLH